MISCRSGVDGSVCKSALPSGVSLATPLRVSLVPALIRLSRTYVTLADVHSLSDGPAARLSLSDVPPRPPLCRADACVLSVFTISRVLTGLPSLEVFWGHWVGLWVVKSGLSNSEVFFDGQRGFWVEVRGSIVRLYVRSWAPNVARRQTSAM